MAASCEVEYFSGINIIDMVRQRLHNLAFAEPHMPRKYGIIVQKDRALNEYFKEDMLYRSGGEVSQPYSSLTSMHLIVNSYGAFLNNSAFNRFIEMYIFGDRNTQSMWLFKDRVEIYTQFGAGDLRLSYHTTGGLIAERGLVSISSDIAGVSWVLDGDVFERINLEAKGFPERINWLDTARMYLRGKIPKGSAPFNADSPDLTFEDIYRRPVIGV